MKIIAIALAASLALVSGAYADTCASKAVDKNGKALAGAAKTSFMAKCKKDAQADCATKAVDKNGKPLTPGQIAFRQRIHECSVEWQRDKAANRLKGQKWPQYWSACNARLKKDD